MNQKRQRGYHWLINALLTCPSYKIEFLQSNPELLDAGLIKTMLEVAEIGEQSGDQNSAKWLRNLATQLAVGMGSSLSTIFQEAEADRLLWQGIELHQTSQFRASFQFLQSALNIYQQIGNRKKEGIALNGLGNAYDFFGQYQKAIDYYLQSLVIAEDTNNVGGKVCCFGNLGKAYCALGDYKEAIDYHQKALSIAQDDAQRTGNPHAHHAAATALGGLGATCYSIGQYRKAIDYYQQQLTLAQAIKDRFEELRALGGLGLVFYSIGQDKQAINHCEQSLKIAQEIGARLEEASCLADLAAIQCNFLSKPSEAVEYLKKSLEILRDIGNRFGESNSLSGLGMAYRSLGLYQEAIKQYQNALDIAQEIGNQSGEANYLANLSMICNLLGRYQQAIGYAKQSLLISREIGDSREEGFALNNLGLALLNFGQLTQAENTLRSAMKIKEFLRGGLEDAHKVSLFDTQTDTYSLLQQAIVLQQRPNEALEIAERGRARAFAELLYKRTATISRSITDELPQRETIDSLTLEQIQGVAQKRNVTIVEYSIINLDHLFIWVIKPNGDIIFCPVYLQPLRKQENISLSDLVIKAREFLGIEENLYDSTPIIKNEPLSPIEHVSRPLQQLYEYLIQPISHLLPPDPNSPIVFIPQGTLFLVPFPALQDHTDKFLIEQYTILTAPSIQVLELAHRSSETEKSLLNPLIVGNPTMTTLPLLEPSQPLRPLPGAEAEATAIAAIFNTEAIIGAAANKVDLVQKMSEARLIHLATHGLLDDIKQLGVPGAIALAPSGSDDGFLTTTDILELRLSAELVFLSACQTGQGQITGDGVIGLSRSFMATGVPRIIVTLWKVDDFPTALLTIKFYENLKNVSQLAPGDVAKALNYAQRWLFNLTSEDAKQELEKLKPHIYQAFSVRRLADAHINHFYLKSIEDRAPRPFASPLYWSAFTTIGF